MGIRIVFDDPPGPISGRFVDAENENGQSINAGDWFKRQDGLWELRIAPCSCEYCQDAEDWPPRAGAEEPGE